MIASTASIILNAILAASWQGSLAVLLILLLRPLLGFRVSARWRCILWLFVLIRLLIPAFALPSSPASLENIPLIRYPALVFDSANRLPPVQGQTEQDAAPPFGSAQLSLAESGTSISKRRVAWIGVGAVLWGVGALVLALSILAALLRLRHQIRLSHSLEDETIAAIWRSCGERFQTSRLPRLLVTSWVTTPALVGFIRPALLIPEKAIQTFRHDDWEHIFMHELAHYRQRDHWIHACQLVALCVHWFNPLIWIGFRFLRVDRELAADELALKRLSGDRALAYGNTLLKVLAFESSERWQTGVIGLMNDATELKYRFKRIIAFKPSGLAGSIIALSITLASAAALLGRETGKGKSSFPPKPAITGKESRLVSYPIPPTRGDILDRNGKVLATNRISYSLAIRFPKISLSEPEIVAFAREQLHVAQKLLKASLKLPKDGAILDHYRKQRSHPFEIAGDLTAEQQAAISKQGGSGLTLLPVSVRSFPHGTAAAHILGFTAGSNLAERGRDGLELTFNEVLSGEPGTQTDHLDAAGNLISAETAKAPQPGKTVMTSLDLDLQILCEKALNENGVPGAIVIIDPNSGELLAMASWPTFAPNAFVPSITQEQWQALTNAPDNPLIGRAFRAVYPPGSLFQIPLSVAAFENDVIAENERLPSPASLMIDGHTFPNWKRSDRGMLNLAEAFEQDSFTWFYQIGMKTGAKPVLDWALKFGFSKRIGIPIPGEAEGALPKKDKFSNAALANLAQGHGCLVSPLQVAHAMALLANKGVAYETRLVTQIRSRDGKVIHQYRKKRHARVRFKPKTLSALENAMLAVAQGKYELRELASAEEASLAAKTANVQIVASSGKTHIASWCAGYLLKGKPTYAFTAVLEHEDGKTSSASTAQIIFRALHQKKRDRSAR